MNMARKLNTFELGSHRTSQASCTLWLMLLLAICSVGTGCSRYVSTLDTGDGVLATWQQGQEDRSQPLVGHFLPMEQVAALLG